MTVTCDTVRGEPPVLLTLTYCVAVELLGILPNETIPGEIAIWAGVAAAPTETPVPLTPKLAVVCLFRLLVTETVPVTAPVLIGLNSTAKLLVLAAFNVNGRDSPSILNPGPSTVADTIVMEIFPALESVTVRVALVPTETFPNGTVEDENETE